MLFFFFLVLFLNIPKEIFGIRCTYSDEPVEISLNEYTYDDLKSKIDLFPSYDYEDDNTDMCRVEIFIDYKANLLMINFGDTFDWSKLNDGEGRLDSLIEFVGNNTEADFYNVLEYACFNQDECDKFFVYEHIDWLIKVNYTSFEAHLRSLLHSNISQTEYNCFMDKIQSTKCSSGVCSGQYSDYYKNYIFECYQYSEASVEVHITTNMIIIDQYSTNKIQVQKSQIIRYTCKFNECNNQILTDELINIVEGNFNLTSMKEGLKNNYLEYKNKKNGSASIESDEQYPDDKKQESHSPNPSKYSEMLLLNTAQKTCYVLINLILTLLIIFI